MILKHLFMTNIRAFKDAEFDFREGMNLLVGVNGAGKTTVLDTLCVLLSRMLPKLADVHVGSRQFEGDDISFGAEHLSAELAISVDELLVSYVMHKPREEFVPDHRQEGNVRDQGMDTPGKTAWFYSEHSPNSSKGWVDLFTRTGDWPLAVYFSPHRALAAMPGRVHRISENGRAGAYTDALESRSIGIRQIAEWWTATEAMAREGHCQSATVLRVLEEVTGEFIEGCSNLRAVKEPRPSLLVDKHDAVLDVCQLSDGERGILSIVLNLAKRLAQANPKLEDPVHNGQAVVLIDELDLHLHPKWQRGIVGRLTTAFQKCQFIATTHSPQVVGSVSPECIQVIRDGERQEPPSQSLGMDTNWILRFLMETDERDDYYTKMLEYIRKLIQEEDYDQAQGLVDKIRDEIGDFPELVRLQTRIDRLWGFEQ